MHPRMATLTRARKSVLPEDDRRGGKRMGRDGSHASSAHLVLFVENHRGELVWAQRVNRCIKRPGTTSSPPPPRKRPGGYTWPLRAALQLHPPPSGLGPPDQGWALWVHPAASAEPSAPCFWPNPGGGPPSNKSPCQAFSATSDPAFRPSRAPYAGDTTGQQAHTGKLNRREHCVVFFTYHPLSDHYDNLVRYGLFPFYTWRNRALARWRSPGAPPTLLVSGYKSSRAAFQHKSLGGQSLSCLLWHQRP